MLIRSFNTLKQLIENRRSNNRGIRAKRNEGKYEEEILNKK
jgi:hypothetical protein